ncbi:MULTISPECIES: hypothetical protein [unclassified Moorena]|uniref:hypothetical protein n=1 Tax=unclassified Moorena TaxID=2683338 RepID=UPI0013F947EC|nr:MULTISPECIES: hypothetical protein [unclassified Moorena]NEP22584.1 hypothetical protein [Moorena sp. SIO3I6]NEQ58173.1 hypothetical protein [Moorena sp. SIO4A1]
MRSHLPITARCDRIYRSQLDAIAFPYHSQMRSHLPITARCDRIYRSQLDAIAFTDQS